ncbi:nuclear transport factor 2 family protein [Dyella sp. 2RAB6]|uniref:nuclear transport factor 2 family protein n=1 Tax=Dyella sp. 2RAB6 TaxID=3232992 RepID=UPI003F8E784B
MATELDEVRAALRRREPIFHCPEFGHARADFEHMTAAAFHEVGASGRRYDREYVLAMLEERHREGWLDEALEVEDFHCAPLDGQAYLVTYTLHQGQRITRRATIWRRDGEVWKILYHQGTLVLDGS